MTPEEFFYFMQGAPPASPNRMMGLDGKPVRPSWITLVQGFERAMRQQHPERYKEPEHTRTRPTEGGYYTMSGPERNQMRAMMAQQQFMMNNPWAMEGGLGTANDPRAQEGYYENGIHTPTVGPDGRIR